MGEMTPADMNAVMNGGRQNDSFFGGDGFWGIIVLFFIFAMFGGGGLWGNNNGLQGALTRGEMADGFNTAEILRNQSEITRDQFGLQRDVLENRFTAQQGDCALQQSIMQNRYDAALGNAATQREILDNRYNTALGFQAVQAQNAECCCDIKTAIHAEGEATRALINANTMQELRDNLQAAQLQLGTLSQTNTLLSAINKVPVPAYLTCSPYETTCNPYTGNGCGCGGYAR